jgi:hypothetical protein
MHQAFPKLGGLKNFTDGWQWHVVIPPPTRPIVSFYAVVIATTLVDGDHATTTLVVAAQHHGINNLCNLQHVTMAFLPCLCNSCYYMHCACENNTKRERRDK